MYTYHVRKQTHRLRALNMPSWFLFQAFMDPFTAATAREAIEQVAKCLRCSPVSFDVARFLDDHDDLRHLREEFVIPKVSHLPPCK